jgi:hypothetical protein
MLDIAQAAYTYMGMKLQQNQAVEPYIPQSPKLLATQKSSVNLGSKAVQLAIEVAIFGALAKMQDELPVCSIALATALGIIQIVITDKPM